MTPVPMGLLAVVFFLLLCVVVCMTGLVIVISMRLLEILIKALHPKFRNKNE